MQFLLDKLDKHQVDPDGVEIYSDAAGEQSVTIDRVRHRAVIRIRGREAVLVRNADGLWVPESDDWGAIAWVFDAPALALMPFGF